MITESVISNCIDEVNAISKARLMVVDVNGTTIANAGQVRGPGNDSLNAFINGDKDSEECNGQLFIKVRDDDRTAYVLISEDAGEGAVCAYLAASQLKNLIIAYRDRIDTDSFFQNLLLDNMLPVDIYNRAAKLNIEVKQRRCVFVVEPEGKKESGLIDMIRELFSTEGNDHVTAVDEKHVVVIRSMTDEEGADDLSETADMLVDMARSEALSDVRVAYGTITDDIKGVSRSYREARMALDVGKIFYPMRSTMEYDNLGVGRLIYQLPVNLCKLFVREIFGDDIPEEIDEEVLTTVNRFFDNSLNVSETSRQLFIHRNTLIYRIEKLQKATGLDVRVFDDALTLKIALMVVNYLKYVKENE